jgi:hypothetical protein
VTDRALQLICFDLRSARIGTGDAALHAAIRKSCIANDFRIAVEERGDGEPLCQSTLSEPASIRVQKESPMTAPKKPRKSATSNKPQRDPLPVVHIPRPGEPNQDQDEIEELEREKIDQRTDEREIIRQTAKPRSSRQGLKGPNNRKQSTSRR